MLRTLLAILILAAPCWAQRLVVPQQAAIGEKVVCEFQFDAPDDGSLAMLWTTADALQTEQIDQRLFIWCKQPGTHKIDLVAIPLRRVTVDGQTFKVIAGEIRRFSEQITFTGAEPVPPTPPGPTPSDVPFPAPGLTVMIVRESSTMSDLPIGQRAIFTSSRVLQWLNSNCVKIDGYAAARIWDDDLTDGQLANVPSVLRTAYRETLNDAAGQLPWIAISDGQRGFSGPLPANIEDTIALLEGFK